MIAGLCESPLTFQAIIIWRDELHEGKVLPSATSSISNRPMPADAQQMQVPVVIDPDASPGRRSSAPACPARRMQVSAADAGAAFGARRRDSVQGAARR